MSYLLHKKAVEESAMLNRGRNREPVPATGTPLTDERADAPERQAAREEVRTTEEIQNEGTVGETAEPEQSTALLNASVRTEPKRPEEVVNAWNPEDPNVRIPGWDQTDKERPGIETEIDVEGTAPFQRDPNAPPGSLLGDVMRWEPVIAQLVEGIRQAIRASGYTTPVIRIKIFGRHFRLGPIPIAAEP